MFRVVERFKMGGGWILAGNQLDIARVDLNGGMKMWALRIVIDREGRTIRPSPMTVCHFRRRPPLMEILGKYCRDERDTISTAGTSPAGGAGDRE